MSLDEAPICLSGGAEGADLQFGMCAGAAGHSVFHFSFPGHKSQAPASEVVVLTREQLVMADAYLVLANQTLKRTFPAKSEHTNNLLRRNYYQAKDTESVYAVAGIDFSNKVLFGGTAWAVQVFIDRHFGQACPVYVFDQEQDRWFTWGGPEAGWTALQGDPPKPKGVWTGIGTSRQFKPNGKAAVRRLLDYTPPETQAA